MSVSPQTVQLQKRCNERSFYAYGTTRIFERRAQRLSKLRNAITFLGIVVPLTVGSLILSFGKMPTLLPWLLAMAGVIGTIQLILSTWSIVARWDEAHAHAVSAILANTRIYNAWERMAKSTPPDFEARVKELEAEDERQEQSDLTQHISYREKRYAMRAALFYRGLPCASCKVKPPSMAPSTCDTCGNF
jgi:mobilome CxxCx(11)CxxC protein